MLTSGKCSLTNFIRGCYSPSNEQYCTPWPGNKFSMSNISNLIILYIIYNNIVSLLAASVDTTATWSRRGTHQGLTLLAVLVSVCNRGICNGDIDGLAYHIEPSGRPPSDIASSAQPILSVQFFFCRMFSDMFLSNFVVRNLKRN